MHNNRCSTDELFNKSGIDPTRHRELVLNVFSDSDRTWTAKGVLAEVRKRRPMDKVTLYRILELFVSRRVLRKISSSTGTMVYEVICEDHRPSHPHLVCPQCGHIECLKEVELNQINLNLNRGRNVDRKNIDLKIEGLCGVCRENNVRRQ